MDKKSMKPTQIRDYILDCREEADQAKQERMDRNKDNFDMFHLRHDFSHKKEGQSREILSKQSMAVEQTRAFFQQSLADLGEWWKAEVCYPELESILLVKPHEITKLTNYMLQRNNYYNHVGNSIEYALLGSLAISKCGGKLIPKPRYEAKKKGRGKSFARWIEKTENKTWEIDFKLVRQSNYYPDPSGDGLYEVEDYWIDYHKLIQMVEADEDFDSSLLPSISSGGVGDIEENFDKARETGQNTSDSGVRKKVKLTEFWGSILNPEGELIYENVQAIVANDTHLILPPRPNPRWDQSSPYTASPLIEVANSVWHRALMDAPTRHNRALVEMYNLTVDAAMNQVHAISQLRKDWLDNPAQVSDGITPGMALAVNSQCPPGGKVLEPLTQVVIPAEAFNVFAIMSQEFNSSALTTDLRQGITPTREQKATAVVEQSQTITSVFTGMAKNYEARQCIKELEKAWQTTAQNWDQIDLEVFISLFGVSRGRELYELSPEEVFSSTVNGIKFRVFGITQTLGKAQDFRKLTTLLQTIGSAPALLEEYLKKYDLGKTLGEIMTALDIDKHKLEIPEAVQMTMQAPEEGTPVEGPQDMSQVPQAGALTEMVGPGAGGGVPQTQFPGSPALIGGNQ